MYCEKEQNKWDEFLPQVMMAYRSSVHSSTHFTPNMMVLGRNNTMPLEPVVCSPSKENKTEPDDYVTDLQTKLHSIHEKNSQAESQDQY